MCAVLGSQSGENQDMGVRAELSVFDRNSDPGLNELTELAAVLCNADYAYLGWMDYNRLWFRSRYGFRASDQPRAATACQWMMDKGEPLLITRNGRAVGRLSPVTVARPPKWDDIMGEVWQAQKRVKSARRAANPVLQERQRRRR